MENSKLSSNVSDAIGALTKLRDSMYDLLQVIKIEDQGETITVVRKGSDEVVARLFKNEKGEWLGICSDDFEII